MFNRKLDLAWVFPGFCCTNTGVNRPASFLLSSTIAILCFIAGCTTPRSNLESPFESLRTTAREQVVLQTVGPAGQSFTGTLNVDGERKVFSGTTPVELRLDVCWMTGEFRKTAGEGKLSFKVAGARRSSSCCTLVRPGSSCWFAYHDGEMRSRQ